MRVTRGDTGIWTISTGISIFWLDGIMRKSSADSQLLLRVPKLVRNDYHMLKKHPTWKESALLGQCRIIIFTFLGGS